MFGYFIPRAFNRETVRDGNGPIVPVTYKMLTSYKWPRRRDVRDCSEVSGELCITAELIKSCENASSRLGVPGACDVRRQPETRSETGNILLQCITCFVNNRLEGPRRGKFHDAVPCKNRIQ